MRKLFLCLAIALLCTTYAVAQANSSSPSAQQTPSAQSSQSSQPAAQQPSSDQGAARSDRGAAKPDSAAGRSADQSAAPADRDHQTAGQNTVPGQQPQRAANGGVPWGWIVLGIVIVAIIFALIGRGTESERVDRVERVETIDRGGRDVIVRDRRDDDIRRVG